MSRMTQRQFDRAVGALAARPKTKAALADILVHGKSWRQAAASRGITMSGILRAMRRMSPT